MDFENSWVSNGPTTTLWQPFKGTRYENMGCYVQNSTFLSIVLETKHFRSQNLGKNLKRGLGPKTMGFKNFAQVGELWIDL